MKKKNVLSAIICAAMMIVTGCGSAADSSSLTKTESLEGGDSTVSTPATDSPFAKHGKLSVNGADLVDANGEKYQLYGMSTHGIAWFPQYINKEAFTTLYDDWNTNSIRLAMYTYENGGYCAGGDQEELKKLIEDGVSYATELGMYVIIDWHVLNEKSPNVYKDEAITFFKEMSEKYKDYDNIIYEICNEPNTTSDWADIKSYANDVIPVIRENDSDAVILVGTPSWSQECDKAMADPLDFDNLMYVVHFYADTHKQWLRDRVEACVTNNFPIFISEFNSCDASGNGSVNIEEGDLWMDLIEKYNISYFCWNLANNTESSSVINSGCTKTSGWTKDDLSETGKWIYEYFINEKNK